MAKNNLIYYFYLHWIVMNAKKLLPILIGALTFTNAIAATAPSAAAPVANQEVQQKPTPKDTKMEPKNQAEIDFKKGGDVFKKENISPADEKEAFKYFKLSADGGYAPAAYNVGIMYLSGSGTEQNNNLAIKYLKDAADKNEVKSQATLGVIYLLGEYGQAKNNTEAHHYLDQVLKNNSKEANQLLTGIALKYNALPGEDNKKEAFKFFKAAADRGEGNASYYVGVAYKDGVAVPKNIPQAVQYFLKSANSGNPFALIKLSEMSQTGEGLPKNKLKSLALAYVAAAMVPKALPIKQALDANATPKEKEEAHKMAGQILKERRLDKFLGVPLKK